RGISDHHHALRGLPEGPRRVRYGFEIVRAKFRAATEAGLDGPADDGYVWMATVRLARGPLVPGQTLGLAVGANPTRRCAALLDEGDHFPAVLRGHAQDRRHPLLEMRVAKGDNRLLRGSTSARTNGFGGLAVRGVAARGDRVVVAQELVERRR